MSVCTCLACFYLLYWIAVSSFAVSTLLKSFKRYQKYGDIEKPPENWKALIRTDFKHWKKNKILIGAVLFLPHKLIILFFFQTVCMLIAYVQMKVGKSQLTTKILTTWLRVHKYLIMKGVLCYMSQEYNSDEIRTPIVISNHVSWLDMYFILLAHGPVSFLVKEELRKYPFLGVCAQGLDCLFLNRSNVQARNQIKNQILARINSFDKKQALAYPLFIFPEGTTSNGDYLLSFKSGAFENKTSVTAFCIKYECDGCSLAIDEISQLETLLIGLSLWPRIKIKRIIINPIESESVEQFTNRIKKQMSQSYNFKLSEGGYRDSLELEKYRKEQFSKSK